MDIAEAFIAFGRDVQSMPGKPEGPEQELHDECGPGLDPVVGFHEVDRLPGWREPLESPRPRVPVEGVGLRSW